MASTYSTNLRLELIGEGEQAGTWGTTTNTNLGTLLDQAIAGYTTVAVASANQAFTASNGGADESRNATIKLTTSTGANFAVYAPPVSKQYVIYNASSYTATIYNSTSLGNTTAAGAGVAIPAGKSYMVWSDGTNFVAITVAASSTNTASAIVQRDGSGNFAAGTITASLTGNVTGNVTGNTSGSAGTLATTNWTIEESAGVLVFKYSGATVASLASDGSFVSAANVTAYGTP